MNSLKTGLAARRIAAAAVVSGCCITSSLVAALPVVNPGPVQTTVSYTFDPTEVLNAPGGGGQTPGVDQFSNDYLGGGIEAAIDPNSPLSTTFMEHAWYRTLQAPDSQTARAAATLAQIPANWSLSQVTISYNVYIVNWVAVENGNGASSLFTFTLSSQTALYRNFNNNATSPNGDAVMPAQNSVDNQVIAGISADVGDGVPANDPSNFPFAPLISGNDSWVASTPAAHPRVDPVFPEVPAFPAHYRDPYNRTSADAGNFTSGSEFTIWKDGLDAVNPDSIPLSLSASGTVSSFSNIGRTVEFRAFSYGSVNITYTFIPEASTWAAAGSMVLAAAGLGVRRWRKCAADAYPTA